MAALVPANAEACFGDPPRQTEDPLSPPCVPFFDGDNGGNTWRGVSPDRIDVVLYNDLGVSGDLGSPDVAGDATLVRTIRTQLDYFAARYQLYERTVRVVALASPFGVATADALRRNDALDAIALSPFATAYLGDGDPSAFLEAMANAGVPTVGLFRHQSREFLDASAPYLWTFLPDRSTITALSAGFLCRKLYGRPALAALDPVLQQQTRRIALVRPADPTTALAQLGEQLGAAVDARCGQRLEQHLYTPQAPLLTAQVMLALKLRNVTTVVCYCDPDTLREARAAATGIGYWPEWYLDDATGALDAGGTAHATFGITSQWRGAATAEQIPSRAFLAEDPSGGWDPRWNATAYYTLLTLFNGFQGSGPNLKPQWFERGLFTFSFQNRHNTFVPLGGFGQYSAKAVGAHSWIDSAMAWWWDPTGTAPGGTPAVGCRRVAESGGRRYASEWPTGDADLYTDTAPCTAAVLP